MGGKASLEGARNLYSTLFPCHSSWLLSWKALRRRCASQSTFMQHPGSQQDSRSPQRASPGGASISSEKQVLGNILASYSTASSLSWQRPSALPGRQTRR